MKSQTFETFVNQNYPCKFVSMATEKHLTKLGENQFFAVIVTDHEHASKRNPHVIALEAYSGIGIVGMEKSSGENNYYISKKYSERSGYGRGESIVIEIEPENIDKFIELGAKG